MMASNTVMMTLDKYDALMDRLRELESLVVVKPPYSDSVILDAEINHEVLLKVARRRINQMPDGHKWELRDPTRLWTSGITVADLKTLEEDGDQA